MKIGYLTNQYPKVSHSFVRREIQALERQGVEIKRYSVRDSAESLIDQQDIAEHKITTTLLNYSIPLIAKLVFKNFIKKPIQLLKLFLKTLSLGVNTESGIIKHLIYLVEAVLLAELLQKDNIQHLHAHFGTNSTTVAMLACKLVDIPFSFTVHGPEEFDKPAFISLPYKIKQAAFVVAISSFGRSQLFRLVENEYWHKIKIVHCGLEPAFFEQTSTENTEPSASKNTMVCIGRLCEQKGQVLIVEALNILHKSDVDFHLTLVGDGEMRKGIEEKIKQYNLTDKVTIAGWMTSDQVKEQINKAKFTLLPSFAEGLPVVLMESMSLRKPAISTYIAGIPELITHNENGWLVPAGDIQALAETIKNVLNLSAEEIKIIGERSRTSVIERHHIDTEATKLKSHFEASVSNINNGVIS